MYSNFILTEAVEKFNLLPYCNYASPVSNISGTIPDKDPLTKLKACNLL